MGQMEE